MRGYFGIGVEHISKAMNLGNLMRSAHAFGASFVFTIGAAPSLRKAAQADTSKSPQHVPYYAWQTDRDMALPKGCQLVGVELVENAVDLPSFRHPLNAAYVLGPERGSLSPGILARCDHVIRIPTSFCLNVQIAGAIVMYDRARSLGGFASRPALPGGPGKAIWRHTHGGPKIRRGTPAKNASTLLDG